MSDTLKELIDSIKSNVINPVEESLSLRLKSAFFGSFIISWSMWNWDRLAYFFLSDEGAIPRIEFLKNSSSFNKTIANIEFSNSFWVPLVLAIIFTLAYPYFSHGISILHNWILDKIEDYQIKRKEHYTNKQTDLVRINEDLESVRAIKIAERERKVAEDKEQAASSIARVSEIISQKATLQTDCNTLKDEIESLNTILDRQMQRKTDLTDELSKLNEELAPLRQQENIYNLITEENTELKKNIEIITSEKESLKYENDKILLESHLHQESIQEMNKSLSVNSALRDSVRKKVKQIEEIIKSYNNGFSTLQNEAHINDIFESIYSSLDYAEHPRD